MVMMVINRPFFLLVGQGERVPFKAGEQDVPEQYASHWYVLANGRVLGGQAEDPAIADAEAAGDAQDASEGAQETADQGETGAGDPPPPPDDEPPADERAALIADAEAAGIIIDKRWGIDRIKAAIAAASEQG